MDVGWLPYCGSAYPLEKVAGDPLVCDQEQHGPSVKHLNSETGFAWWES